MIDDVIKHWINHIDARQSDRLLLVELLLVGAYQRRSALGRIEPV